MPDGRYGERGRCGGAVDFVPPRARGTGRRVKTRRQGRPGQEGERAAWLLLAGGIVGLLSPVGVQAAEAELSLAGFDMFSALPVGLGASLLGFVFGMKHALDADHVAAVATIATAQRSWWRAGLVGAWWGLGHSVALLGAGLAVIVGEVRISARVEQALETVVAIMLVGLGLRALRRLWRGGRLHAHFHRHGGRWHFHPHLHLVPSQAPVSHHEVPALVPPFAVGLVHGLAGSAAVMLLVLASIPGPTLGFVYLVAFGLGSVGGMTLLSGLLGLPLQADPRRFGFAQALVSLLAALGSIVCGLLLAWRLGGGDSPLL